MSKDECDARVQQVRQRANGRWTEILRALAGDHAAFKGSNQGCPVCGKGKDGFATPTRMAKAPTSATAADPAGR
jgi:phage/plasmid primase-like uncharacterized protein